MKGFKNLLSFILIAAVSIAVWEIVQSFSRNQINVRGFSICKKVFVANQAALNAALPTLIALAGTESHPQAVGNNLQAFVRGDSSNDCAIIIPVKSVGDFYQFTYDFGLVWTTHVNRLAEENPAIILAALEDGWWIFASVQPQWASSRRGMNPVRLPHRAYRSVHGASNTSIANNSYHPSWNSDHFIPISPSY